MSMKNMWREFEQAESTNFRNWETLVYMQGSLNYWDIKHNIYDQNFNNTRVIHTIKAITQNEIQEKIRTDEMQNWLERLQSEETLEANKRMGIS